MMICPQTYAPRQCNTVNACEHKLTMTDIAKWNSINRIDGTGFADSTAGIPPKPTMADFNRLLEAYYAARYEHEHGAGAYLRTKDYADATDALLAIVRPLLGSDQ